MAVYRIQNVIPAPDWTQAALCAGQRSALEASLRPFFRNLRESFWRDLQGEACRLIAELRGRNSEQQMRPIWD